jgi:curli biogenesis system outer membrane secretion channel CsgG
LILCQYYEDEARPAKAMKLRVRVVDSETGAIVGSVLTEGYRDFEEHAKIAVEALKKDLLDGGYRRGYAMPPEVAPPAR